MRKATRQLQQQVGVAQVIEPADPRRLTVEVARSDAAPSESTPTDTSSVATGTVGTVGTVKFFSSQRGYGFIARPDDADLFVHHTNIKTVGAKSATTLSEGQRVRYTIGVGRRGPEAMTVTLA
jgi:CspA family cold shock protein